MDTLLQHLAFSWHDVVLYVLEYLALWPIFLALRIGRFKLQMFLFRRKLQGALSEPAPEPLVNRVKRFLPADSASLRQLAKAPRQDIESILNAFREK